MIRLFIGEAVSGTEAVKQVLDALTGSVDMATIVSYLTIGITASLGLVLGWFGIRKLTRMLMTAFKTGKFKI